MANSEKIALQVDISRVIEVLSRQIYQSPLALLRENTQNAFDAVVMRKQLSPEFEPSISIQLTQTEVRVEDNGIGMTREDLENHFWRAGSSSKNNAEARAAGVVGTFGIGAMANFGIASHLTVITESAIDGTRNRSSVARESLSTETKCIDLVPECSTGNPGTTIIATIIAGKQLNVAEALNYIRDFVAFAPVKIICDGSLISRQDFESAVASIPVGWTTKLAQHSISMRLIADVKLIGAPSGEVRISLSNITLSGKTLSGRLILRQGISSIRTFRNGFGLATTSVNSAFAFGGAADLLALQPTAGREALETESLQLLQSIVSDVDAFAAQELSKRSESNLNTYFINWVIHHSRFDYAGHVRIRCEPGNTELPLREVAASTVPWKYYSGSDAATIMTFATDDTKLLVVAQNNPRKQCQIEFLRRLTKSEEIPNNPSVLKKKEAREFSISEAAVVFRLSTILQEDYFLKSQISLGKISHDLPVLVDQTAKPVLIVLDPDSPTLRVLINIYTTEYSAFGGMAKDFIRNIIFPRVSDLVPSSTRQGADAFLKSIRRQREVFEIGLSDMTGLGAIWEKYLGGEITMDEAAKRSTEIVQLNIQRIDRNATTSVRSVVPDVIENEKCLANGTHQTTDPLPPIVRLESESDAKLLVVEDNEPPLKDYRCFVALTDRTREEYGDFFLQPHRTSIVWGGQKTLFIFQHHSGRFGLYYDLQLPSIVAKESGGASFETCTLIIKNRIYIPVPDAIRHAFVPSSGEIKRIEVRCDLLYTDDSSDVTDSN